MGDNPITIKDIAKILGIAPSTVSRALKNHPDISSHTKKLVNELAAKLHYQPNSIAVSLRGQKTYTVGVIVPELVHYFFSTVISGIETVALEAGYNVLVCSSNASYHREVSVAKDLLNRRVDGLLICVAKNSQDSLHLLEYQKRGIPLVFFDCASDTVEADKVVIDDFQAAKMAVLHLLDQGCSAIAYLGGPQSLGINTKRYHGYANAIESRGYAVDPRLVVHVDEGSLEDGRRATRALLNLPEVPDGIFATADLLGIGAIKEIKDYGLVVPRDIALVGFSNWEIAALCEPSLTSVLQPGEAMGQKAMNMLLNRLENGDGSPLTEVLETELLVRESSLRI